MNDNFFVFSDIHGNYNLWKKVEEFIAGRPAIFLGDAADRGPDGYKIMKELLDSPNIIYLKGNHEDMFVDAAKKYLITKSETCEPSDIDDYNSAYNLLSWNGGLPTYNDWEKDGCSQKIIHQLDNLPVYYSVGQFDFCHSGCLKVQWEHRDEISQNNFIWNRVHFPCDWFEGRTLIHGHTITRSLSGYRNFNHEIVRYNNKIDIDIGTIICNKIAVYDTMTDRVVYLEE